MPFRLKNIGTTYQRLVNKIFQPLLKTKMKVYVDDMLTKSVKAQDPLADMEEKSSLLQKYNMKLNPTKCMFEEKFLGYMTTSRGIEANLVKIEAILKMGPLRTKKKVEKLIGCLVALGRFMSKGAEKTLPFLKALRGVNSSLEWSPKCQAAFDDLKDYL